MLVQIILRKIIPWNDDFFKLICNYNIFTAKIFSIILNGKTLLYSGLFWKCRGNTETRTVASDFIRPSIESSLTRREKKCTSNMWCEWWGKVAFYKLLIWTRLENSNVGIKKIIWKLLIFSMLAIWRRFHVILAPSSEEHTSTKRSYLGS